MPRLRHVSPQSPGWTRRRAGKGFVYLDEKGDRVTGADAERCRGLVIPPAWTDVWICPHPAGHLQAVGTDDAGRRQYLYHPQWQQLREEAKYDHVLAVAEKLPRARRRALESLSDEKGITRQRVLATAFRLLDIGVFRIGGERYAEDHDSYGLVTLEKHHVHVRRGRVSFDYSAKSGKQLHVDVTDDALLGVLPRLCRRRAGSERLLAFKDGSRWRDLSTEDVNGYVKKLLGEDASAKDFRTWHGTVLAAVVLDQWADARSKTARKKAVTQTMRDVAERLGNTPAVTRSSYVDPRVVERFEEGVTLSAVAPRLKIGTDVPPFGSKVEKAVLRMLAD
jgi:DNA topoisomerase I